MMMTVIAGELVGWEIIKQKKIFDASDKSGNNNNNKIKFKSTSHMMDRMSVFCLLKT